MTGCICAYTHDAVTDEDNEVLEAGCDRYVAKVLAPMIEDAEQRVRAEYEHMISWDVTCRNCANLLDKSYEEYAKYDALRARIEALLVQWQAERQGFPHGDPRAHVAFVTVALCEEELRAALEAKP